MVKTPLPTGDRDVSSDLPGQITQRIELPNVSWQTYQALLADLGDQRSSRLA